MLWLVYILSLPIPEAVPICFETIPSLDFFFILAFHNHHVIVIKRRMRRDLFQEVGVVIVGEVNPANGIFVLCPLVYEVLRYFLEKKLKHNFHFVCLYWKFIFDQDKRKDPITQSCFPFLREPLWLLSVRNFFFSEAVLNRTRKSKIYLLL